MQGADRSKRSWFLEHQGDTCILTIYVSKEAT